MNRSGTSIRLAAEFVVIVVGVLSALAVDQYMERRRDREHERELLESFIENLRTDSADFAELPGRALQRVRGAEVLLLNLAPGAPRSARVQEALDTLGPFEGPATDSTLIGAFAGLGRTSDLDPAMGAYREFSDGGAQRLVRNRDLKRAIHEYYYLLESNRKFDPRVIAAMVALNERAHDRGLAPGDSDAALIRGRLRGDSEAFFAALRDVQVVSLVQSDIAARMLEWNRELMTAIRAELGGAR